MQREDLSMWSLRGEQDNLYDDKAMANMIIVAKLSSIVERISQAWVHLLQVASKKLLENVVKLQ